MKRIVLLSLVLALPGCGWFGGDDSPTAPPPPCVPIESGSCTRIDVGEYACTVQPAGPWTPVVDGVDRPLEFGNIVRAEAGSEIAFCRCGVCTRPQPLQKLAGR